MFSGDLQLIVDGRYFGWGSGIFNFSVGDHLKGAFSYICNLLN